MIDKMLKKMLEKWNKIYTLVDKLYTNAIVSFSAKEKASKLTKNGMSSMRSKYSLICIKSGVINEYENLVHFI